LGSAISGASSARLFRRSIRLSGIGLSRQLLGLLIDHFAGDQAVFKGRIAIDEAAALLLQVLGTGLGSLGRFQELFQNIVHSHNIYRVGFDCHSTHIGKLSCFRPGISTCLLRSIASALAIRRRVECGMIVECAALGGGVT